MKARKSTIAILPCLYALAAALLAAWLSPAEAQSQTCSGGFELPRACITERGLDEKVAAFQHKIVEALSKLGASYKIEVRIIDNPNWGPYGTPTDGTDVWTDVVRNEEMRNESFIINVTARFLQAQPDILFESSTLHEVCHIKNDDLNGYHRQGRNIEVAEERCVADAVGMTRYQEYLRAYFKYKPNMNVPYETFLQRVRDVVLVPPPVESDDADRMAAAYFKGHADGKEHLLIYNGEIHDVTLVSTRDSVRIDPEKLQQLIAAGKPLIFFHNHPGEDGRAAMFPSYDDFGVAALFSFMVWRENPSIAVEFRVMQVSRQNVSSVSYGFKRPVIEQIKKNAEAYRNAMAQQEDVAPIQLRQNILDYRLAQESYNEYLQHAYRLEVIRTDKEACAYPQYFLWPSEKFFLHDRPQASDRS